MRHLALFNGIGGFQLAAHWMGWNNVAHVEIDEECNRVVKKHFPESICHTDIKEFNAKEYAGAIDIISGSDPCQPHSYAGKRNGIDDARFLWPEMLRSINEIGPIFIINENVVGTITNGVLDRKISDLESIGYTCWPPFIIPANAVGALHERKRIWLVAHSERLLKSREKSCMREIGRMGREFKYLAWDGDWENKLSEFRRMDDGISNRVDRTDGTRNAIVPQVALQIFKTIQAYEDIIIKNNP